MKANKRENWTPKWKLNAKTRKDPEVTKAAIKADHDYPYLSTNRARFLVRKMQRKLLREQQQNQISS